MVRIISWLDQWDENLIGGEFCFSGRHVYGGVMIGGVDLVSRFFGSGLNLTKLLSPNYYPPFFSDHVRVVSFGP